MKRFLIALVCVVMFLVLVGCSSRHYASSYKATLFVHSNRANSSYMRFSGFDGKMVFKMKSSGNDTLSCSAKLESGSATLYYDDNGTKTPILSIHGGEEVSTKVASLKAGKVYVIVETDGKCSGGDFTFDIEK